MRAMLWISSSATLAWMTIVVLVALIVTESIAAEKFNKLTGSQIHAKFSSMEMTDEVHFSDVFAPNGTLTAYSMSRKKFGKWSVQKDELCVDRGKDDSGCYEVWLSGRKVELRRAGSTLGLEGVLQRPINRK